MNAGHSRRRSAQSRAPEADLVSDVIGVKIENRTNILEREVWLAVPALDPLLRLPAEQTGREIPGILAFSETSKRIRENRKLQSHFARLCGTTRQRLHRAEPIRILAWRRSLALKTWFCGHQTGARGLIRFMPPPPTKWVLFVVADASDPKRSEAGGLSGEACRDGRKRP